MLEVERFSSVLDVMERFAGGLVAGWPVPPEMLHAEEYKRLLGSDMVDESVCLLCKLSMCFEDEI